MIKVIRPNVKNDLFFLTLDLKNFNIFLGNFIKILQEFGSVRHVVSLYQDFCARLSVWCWMVTGPYREVHLALVGELLGINLETKELLVILRDLTLYLIRVEVVDQRNLLIAGPSCHAQLDTVEFPLEHYWRLVAKLERVAGRHLIHNRLLELLPLHLCLAGADL